MKRIQLIFLILAIVVSLFGCSKSHDYDAKDLFNQREISLTQKDKTHLLAMARGILEQKPFQEDRQSHPNLYAPKPRGLFLTILRPNEFALTTFGIGHDLTGALEKACKTMRRLGVHEDFSNLQIRLDVIAKSTDEKTYRIGEKWRKKGRDQRGILFDAFKPLALLPEEMIQRGVIYPDGKLFRNRLRRVVIDRGIGTIVRENFDDDKQINYCFFTPIGFMENKPGVGLIELQHGRRPVGPLEDKTLLLAARDAENYLSRTIRPDGTFVHKYKAYRNLESSGYNPRHHAGTCYALAELYEATHDQKVLEKFNQTLKYILDSLEEPNPGDEQGEDSFQAMFYKNSKGVKTATAGASAYALLALAKYTTLSNDMQYLPQMQALGRFIRHQTEQSGYLNCRYYRNPKEATKPLEIVHYAGECIWALAELYQFDPNQEWIKTAKNLANYIVTVRDAGVEIRRLPYDYGFCIGINQWYPTIQNQTFIDHAFKSGEGIRKRMNRAGRADWIGGFSSNPRSRPAAMSNEAVLALYALAGKTDRPTDEWLKASKAIAQFQCRLQVDFVSGMFLKHPDKAYGGFFDSFINPEIRIDYVQHNISALLGLWRIQRGE